MTTLTPKPLTSQTFYRGATFRGRLPVTVPDGTAKDLTGAAVRWGLLKSDDTLALPESALGSGVSFEGSPTLGVLVITVLDSDTATLPEVELTQEWVITDGVGDVQIYRGRVFVADSELPA